MAACAGDKPNPARPIDPALPAAQAVAEPDKGQGNLSFHYSNKSTDANLAIDLSSTDVYLEMTGKSAQEQVDQLRAQGMPDPRKPAPAGRKSASGEEAKDPGPKGDEGKEDAGAEAAGAEAAGEESKAEKPRPPLPTPKAMHKAPPKKPEPPPEEDPADYEDVTSKVLAGIRRAQELFYQKRYPEALQAARSSLDARPTAEGYGLLGSIYFMQGNIGMARRQWMEALRLNPDMPAVVNMLDKTRTPGGRGSPAPRPVYHPPARPADPDAPYPEEYQAPGPETAPPAPAAPARPVPSAPAASAPTVSAPVPTAPARAVSSPLAAPAPAAAAAAPAPIESAVPTGAASPQPEEDGDEEAAVPAVAAPTAAPAPATRAPAVTPAPANTAVKGAAATPKVPPKAVPKAAPASAKPGPAGTR